MGYSVELSWADEEVGRCSATLQVPTGLTWSLVRGSTDPELGWYSSGFGDKEPTTTVLGEGVCCVNQRLETLLQFGPAGDGDAMPLRFGESAEADSAMDTAYAEFATGG